MAGTKYFLEQVFSLGYQATAFFRTEDGEAPEPVPLKRQDGDAPDRSLHGYPGREKPPGGTPQKNLPYFSGSISSPSNLNRPDMPEPFYPGFTVK